MYGDVCGLNDEDVHLCREKSGCTPDIHIRLQGPAGLRGPNGTTGPEGWTGLPVWFHVLILVLTIHSFYRVLMGLLDPLDALEGGDSLECQCV